MRERGIIKAFFPTPKGFGFIGRTGSRDIFFHVTEFAGDAETITRGAAVEFTVTTDDRTGRPNASNVVPCEETGGAR